jgi:tRNA threonylcarbamoyladenosine biosynthesis protein TsaE
LINEYSYQDTDNQQEKYIYHIDLYRLKKSEEALDIGIEDYLFDDNYCLIEWPELINELLPADRVIIQIEIIDDFTRKFLFL